MSNDFNDDPISSVLFSLVNVSIVHNDALLIREEDDENEEEKELTSDFPRVRKKYAAEMSPET